MTLLKVSEFGKPGFVKDIAAFATTPQAWDEVKNVRFNSIGAQTFAGESPVLSPAGFSPLWLKAFPPIEAPIWVYAGLGNVFGITDLHYDLTRASGAYSGQANERWQGEVLNGVGFFNNVIDIPQMWVDFDVSQKLQDLANWPSNLRCKALRPFKNFLIAMYLIESGNEKPFRIRWSDAAAPGTVPSSWALNDPTKYSGEKDIAETEDYIIDGLRLGELFMVYKQQSMYALQFIDRPDVFAHWRVLGGRGLLWRDCVQEFPGGHFVAGLDDIYVHNGSQNSSQSIVEAQLRNWIFRQIDSDNFFNCFTVYYKTRSEIWFCFPEAGETYATLAAVWNIVTGGIGIRELRSTPFIYPGPIDMSADLRIWGGIGAPVLAGVLDGNNGELTWTEPEATDISISNYILYRRKNRGNWAVHTATVDLFYTDLELDPNSVYDYYVVAAAAGPEYSDQSNQVTLTTGSEVDGVRLMWPNAVLFPRTQGNIGVPQTPNGYEAIGGVTTPPGLSKALVARASSFTGGSGGAFQVRVEGTDVNDSPLSEDITVAIGEAYHVGASNFKTFDSVTLLSTDFGTDQSYCVGYQYDSVVSTSGFSDTTMRGAIAINAIAPTSGSVERLGLLGVDTPITTLPAASQISIMRYVGTLEREFVINGAEFLTLPAGSQGQEVLSLGTGYVSFSSLSCSGTGTNPTVDIGLIGRFPT